MKIPCVSIVIPVSTSPVVRAPAYMAPLYLEIWRNRLASEGKTSVEVLPIVPAEYKEIASVYSEKEYLAAKFGRNEGNGQIVFDKVYPGDLFERTVEQIMKDEAARELATEQPAARPYDVDLAAALNDVGLASELHAVGVRTMEDVAGANISKLCEVPGMTPGFASKLIARISEAVLDDAQAKEAMKNAKPLEEKSAKK